MKSLIKSIIITLLTGVVLSSFSIAHFSINTTYIGADSARLLKQKYHLGLSAHRGSSIIAPENTLASFKAVLEMGVDYIEIDVRTTKDGQLVILHDATLNRTTNGQGPMKDFTLAELKQLSAARGYNDIFKEERIPTLHETTKLLAHWNRTHKHKTNLYVDCKDIQPEPLVAQLKASKLMKDAVFYGSDDFLLALKKVYPKAKLMPSLNKADEIDDKIKRFNPYAFDVRWLVLNQELVADIHKRGVKVFSDALGLLDTPANYKKATVLGIDVIQTDHVRKVYKTLLD